MATGGEAVAAVASNSLDELLICPVCLDSFKDPKTLGCLHSFCTDCLESCRRPYRRDLTCPVCKKITHLPPSGIKGLQHDFRIQQIRDILQKQCTSPPPSSAPMQCEEEEMRDSKFCDLCKSQQKRLQATHHCTHCCMYFCKQCLDKHNVQTLFSSHHVVDMSNNDATDVLFCKTHKDQPLRYFCKVCNSMMCTICTMDHESDHGLVPLDKGVIDKYHQELQDSLNVLSTKLSEVKSRSKYVETMKQTYRKALYEAQRSIRDKTNEIISSIREQEKQLLQDVQRKTEDKMKGLGLDVLGEMNFHRTNIETLHTEVQSVIQGSPQHCLTVYEDLIARMKSVADAPLPSMQKSQTDNVIKFVPTNDDILNAAIGQLKECIISEEDKAFGDDQPASPVSYNSVRTSRSKSKRSNSVLNALSPSRKSDVKVGKVKAFFAERPPRASSPNAINADDLLVSTDPSLPSTSGGVASGSSQQDEAKSAAYGSHLDTPPASPVDDPQSQLLQKPRLLFKVDQVGGWPGKIMSPVAAAFQADCSVVVAESENRLQLFDQGGQSQRVIGWGKVKPQGLAIAPNGRLCITDRKDKCVKMFSPEGEMVGSWGTGMFSNPSGIATSAAGKFVITDVDKHMISIHGSDGSLLTQFGSWGSGEYQFNSPSYTTIGPKEQIVISDSGNNCIKVYDINGKFLGKTGMLGNTQLRRPQGICFDPHGNLAVADRDNHRICLFSQELKYICTLLGKHDGIKYPCDVTIGANGQVIVVESHSGFLTKDPHHAIKMYQIYS